MILNAKGWAAPAPHQIASMVDGSGLAQAEVAARSGLSIDRLKRLMGRKASFKGYAVRPCAFGEWLAIVIATDWGHGSLPHPAGDSAAHIVEKLRATVTPTTQETP